MAEQETITLRDIPVGGSAKVLKIVGSGVVRRHIMDMGITKGIEVYVRKVAPLGDPVELTVRGYELSLRKSEAENVIVEPLQ
ncbi:FeoA family protein [Slackia heliotrinireducens]|jgi:ferrous iron transport protein A|uniref:Fe2+ transport system protein A n=1 Tax=Slackia heliotrinireducens (strain ATCC 29202 / DSM 20476 / NCTC 11029 / RHS 1) TaxID=471855 RepID=C7N7Y5_SLAHD|nr:FeoA family protein [Slackia heliotrinireducens]ACV23020.1 Fe2+ transport system protein A [Slackia heliotrinireducens DSM 20476]VEH01933.1 ferrous iron transport protein A [Slackia heliotrinireducens]